MSPTDQVELLVLLVCLTLSAFFSSSETAFVGVDRLRLETLARDGHAGARRALSLLRQPRLLLTVILIGNNVANVLAAALGTLVAVRHLGEEVGVALGGIIVTVVLVLFCEVLPKSYASAHPERLAMRLARPLRWVSLALRPIAWLLHLLSRSLERGAPPRTYGPEEVRAIVRRWADEGALPEAESKLIAASLRLRELPVRNVMTPLAELVAVADDTAGAEALELCLRAGHSRLPVYRDRIDDVVGVLHLRDALVAVRAGTDPPPLTRELMRRPTFVPGAQLIGDVLRQLQSRRTALAVVTDELGGTIGICTVEDILEELVGEIWEEHDIEPHRVIRTPTGELLASGKAEVRELVEDWGVALPEGPYRTLQGLFFSALCRMPVVGDQIDLEQVILEVEAADSRMVQRVRIRRLRRPILRVRGNDDEPE